MRSHLVRSSPSLVWATSSTLLPSAPGSAWLTWVAAQVRTHSSPRSSSDRPDGSSGSTSLPSSWRRLLRPGGRLAVADIVTEKQLTDAIIGNAELWAACTGGAAQEDTYRALIESAGMVVREVRRNGHTFISDQARSATTRYGVKSISLLAIKT
jgi:hypothetical protein